MSQRAQYLRGTGQRTEEKFSFRKVPEAFISLPRVLRLVWSTSVLLTTLLGLLNLAQGFIPALSVSITALVIDSVVRAIKIHSISPIWLPIGLQLVIALLSSLLNNVSNIVQQLLQEQVSNRVQLEILKKANTLDLAFFENPEFYDKMRQATNQSTYQPVSMISQTFGFGQTIVTLASLIFLLVHLAWWLAIVALLVPIPAFFSSTRYGWRGYQLMRRQSPERRLMAYFVTLMTTDTYNKEVKLFNLGEFFIGKFWDLATTLYKQDRKLLLRRYNINFLWTSLTVIANTAIYLYVALQAVAGRITLGGLTLYTQTAVQVGQNFQSLLNGISNTYENTLYVNTLFDFLEYQPAIVSPPEPRPVDVPVDIDGLEIEFRDVSFTYPGKDPETQAALKHVSFTIHTGEAIALVGRNGAGKTTLVKLLTRLYDPDEGEIFIGGRNIKEYDLKDLREQVGVIFQDYVNYYMTAQENIGVGRVAHIEQRDLVMSAASKSGASAVIEKLPNGYDTMLGRWFKDLKESTQLSGGEWQKIALARAFMRDARILVLDEPTSALDAQAEYEVFTKFRELTRGKTAVFISHRFSTVRLADRIFVIENGSIIESGSHEELIALDGRYAELFNLQAEAYR
ncbi:MAG TPA: ABC transporter ATP-binding protein [Ktedonobacteraceae bacterium]|nr:ABC transporter ATP-binding protein [Ktedonobacteraceae bacterium]